MRLLATQAANYFQDRREQRLDAVNNQEQAEDCPPCPPYPSADDAAMEDEDTTGNTIWYALSGILLGSAFSLMLYVMLRDDNPRL